MHTGVQRKPVSIADGRPARQAGGKFLCPIAFFSFYNARSHIPQNGSTGLTP